MKATAASPPSQSPLEELAALPQLHERARVPVLQRLFRDPSPAIRQAAARLGASLLSEDIVVAFLRNASDDVLRNAAVEMLKYGGARSVALARLLLHDRDKDVVLHAVLLLQHFRDAGAIGPLRQLLTHPDQNVVQSAIVALGHVGHAGIAAELLPFLREDLWLQIAAVEAFGHLRSQVAVEPLARMLSDPMLGPSAADALARIGGTGAFEHLAKFLVDGDFDAPERLEQLAGTIESHNEPAPPIPGLTALLEGYMSSDDKPAVTAAARCLLAVGPGEWDTEALDVLATNWESVPTIPGCLRRRPDLIPALLRTEGIRRRWGFRLAEEFPTRVPADVFAEALAATREHVQFEAATGAMMASAGEDVRAQLPRMYSRLPADLRPHWAPVIARFRNEISRRALDEPGIDPGARQVLEVALEEDPAAATRKLLGLDTAKRTEALAHLVDQPAVLQVLPWGEWLREDPDAYGSYAVRHAANAALGSQMPAIRECLRTEPHRDHIRLAGRLRDEESVPLLVEIISRGEDGLIPFALAALGAIGGESARDVLRAYCAQDWEWARLAYHAFAECALPTDLGPFRTGVDHHDWHVRMICARALQKAGQRADAARLALLSTDPVDAVAAEAQGAIAS